MHEETEINLITVSINLILIKYYTNFKTNLESIDFKY